MQKKTQTIRFMVLADHHTLSNRPCYAMTIQGISLGRIDQQQMLKRPEYIRTQL